MPCGVRVRKSGEVALLSLLVALRVVCLPIAASLWSSIGRVLACIAVIWGAALSGSCHVTLTCLSMPSESGGLQGESFVRLSMQATDLT